MVLDIREERLGLICLGILQLVTRIESMIIWAHKFPQIKEIKLSQSSEIRTFMLAFKISRKLSLKLFLSLYALSILILLLELDVNVFYGSIFDNYKIQHVSYDLTGIQLINKKYCKNLYGKIYLSSVLAVGNWIAYQCYLSVKVKCIVSRNGANMRCFR